MKDYDNRFEDFFFFFLKLLCVCLACVAMYLAYNWYEDKQINDSIDEVTKLLDHLL